MSFSPPLLRRFALAMLAALTTMVAAVPGAQAAPEDFGLPPFKYSTFYIPPEPLPAVPDGTLLRAERINFRSAYTKPPPGTIGYRIMYMSRTATGRPVAVTGTVMWVDHIAPPQGKSKRPLIAYGNEAMGLGDNCNVSRLVQYAHSGEVDLVRPMLRHGYQVVASDYEGLGTPDVATFGVTQSAARTMLDSIRAARQLPNLAPEWDLPKKSKVGLFGYSQGAGAAAGAAEIADWYAPEIDITAASMGGAPIDPHEVTRFVDGGFFSAINFAASIGYDAAYPELELTSFLNEKGMKVRDESMTSCIEAIFTLINKRSVGYLKDPHRSPIRDPRWIKRFDENLIGRISSKAPSFPMYYFHATFDQASPYKSALRLRRDWCKKGAKLRYVELQAMEHVAAGPLWMPEAGKWLAAQIDRDRNDRGNCGRSIYSLPKLSALKLAKK